jgi:hypothetical protein
VGIYNYKGLQAMLKKSIKFPLVMHSGAKVRTIEELRENFDLDSVIELFFDGRLMTWLEQRFYKRELEQIEKIKDMTFEEAEAIAEKLYEIFAVPFSKDSLDVSHIIKKGQKMEMLKQLSNGEHYNVEQVVLSQEELCGILKDNKSDGDKIVYLLGDTFEVSDEYPNVHYIGLNSPTITLLSKGKFNAKQKGISFTNVTLMSDKDVSYRPGVQTNVNFGDKCVKAIKSEFKNMIGNIHFGFYDLADSGFSDGHRNIFIYEDTVVIRKGRWFDFYDLNSGKKIIQFKSKFYGFDNIQAFRESHLFYILDYEKVEGPGNRHRSVLNILDLADLHHFEQHKLDLIWNDDEITGFGNIYVDDHNLFINQISIDSYTGVGDGSYSSYTVNLTDFRVRKNHSYKKFGMKFRTMRGGFTYRDDNDCFAINNQELYYIPYYGSGELLNPKDSNSVAKIGMKGFKIAANKIFALPLKGIQENADGGLYFNHSPFPSSISIFHGTEAKRMAGKIGVYDLKSGNKMGHLHSGEISFMNIVNRYLVTARQSSDGIGTEISLWDTDTLKKSTTIKVPGVLDRNFSIDIQDERMAVLCKDQLFVFES